MLKLGHAKKRFRVEITSDIGFRMVLVLTGQCKPKEDSQTDI